MPLSRTDSGRRRTTGAACLWSAGMVRGQEAGWQRLIVVNHGGAMAVGANASVVQPDDAVAKALDEWEIVRCDDDRPVAGHQVEHGVARLLAES